MSKSVEYVCPECGGINVLHQNLLEWNIEKQEWNVEKNPYSDTKQDWFISTDDDRPDIEFIEWCNDCKDEVSGLIEREIK